MRGSGAAACSARLKRRSSSTMLALALTPRLRNCPRPACSLRYSARACLHYTVHNIVYYMVHYMVQPTVLGECLLDDVAPREAHDSHAQLDH